MDVVAVISLAIACSEAMDMLSGEAEVGGVELREDATLDEASTSASVGGVADRKLDSGESRDSGSRTASAMMSAMLSTWLKQLVVLCVQEGRGGGRRG